MRKDWNARWSLAAYAFNVDGVGVLQEKLASVALELTVHLAQQSENPRVDKVAGGAAAGPAADPPQPGEPTDER